MIVRSRTTRFAGLALALALPVVAATATPAFAEGESAEAELVSPETGSSTTFTWSYEFHRPEIGGNAFSNLAIGFCSDAILGDVESVEASSGTVEIFEGRDVQGGHDGFGPGIKVHMPEDTGTITVTFGSAHPIAEDGLKIQSHSGTGQDAITWADGPGPCPVDPGDDGDGGSNGGGSNGGGSSGGGSNGGGSSDGGSNGGGSSDGGSSDGGSNGGGSSDGGTTAGGTDQVLGAVLENNGGGSNGGTQTTASPADPAVTNVPTASPGAAVSGNELTAGAQLPRTGAGVQFLVTLAFSLVLAGLALRAASSRGTRSASFPG